jgi:copper chaperone
MIEKTYKIEGMSCNHCVKSVEVELSEIEVEAYNVELGSAKVKYDETKLSDSDIAKAVEEAGFIVVN